MVCEADLITTGEAMHMKYTVTNSGWYTMGRDYLLNVTGEPFSILDIQPLLLQIEQKNIYFFFCILMQYFEYF